MKNILSPEEKKLLSYSKDRRNNYGGNNKSSRKNIPRSKALSIRSERHEQAVNVRALSTCLSENDMTAMENTIHSQRPRYWKKEPDIILRHYLHKKR